MAFLTQVYTNPLTNQDISAALPVGTFTNTTRIRKLYINVFVDQVTGSGDYSAWLTVQRAGAGSEYPGLQITRTLGVGVTSVLFNFEALSLNATDVLKVYVMGLVVDTTTPDIVVDVNEEWIAVDASGRMDLGLWLGVVPSTLASGNVQSAPQTDSPGTTTLLARLTAARAGYLDLLNSYLDVAISAIRTIVNAIKAKTDNLPADPASEASVESAITTAQGIITTQTDLIKAKTANLPSSPAATGAKMDIIDAPNATGIAAIQSGLATGSALTAISNKLGAWTGSGRNTILGWAQALFRKDADATVPTDINTNLGSGAGAADNTTDSVEAIRDNMTSSSAPTAAQNANAVWDALRSAHTVSGSFGEGVASVQGNVTGSANSVTGAVGSVTGGVGGNVTGSVGSVVGSIGGSVPDSSGITTLLTRLSATRAGYLDALAGFTGTLKNMLKAMASRVASASADIGGTHDPATDSEEAMREKIDTLSSNSPTVIQDTTNELNT